MAWMVGAERGRRPVAAPKDFARTRVFRLFQRVAY